MTNNKPEIITCPKFSELGGIKHGFFTRKGGVSSGIYDSLNVGLGSNDQPGNALENRKIAIAAFGGNSEDSLQTVHQTHSSIALPILTKFKFEDRPEADGMVTNRQNIVLGILTADCTPVLFADATKKIIGAAHAGWKGACSGILENTIIAMQNLGANKQNIHAVIGPTIAQKSYEVGADFFERFMGFDQNNEQFFIPSKRDNHYMFNLTSYVEGRLLATGIKSVTNVQRDTCAEAEDFFSYRRSCLNKEPDYGRNLSVIALD